MLTERTRGVFVISATPFTDDGDLDLASADSLVEFYLEQGVHGITVLGMMGEAPKLTFAETITFVQHVLERVAGRVPVVVGVSSPGLATLRDVTKAAMGAGAAAVLVAPSAGLRTDEQIYAYYAGVMEAVGPSVPVIYQDYPQSTAVSLSASNFNRMVKAFPQLVMLKAEDCPGLGKITAIREQAEREGLRRVSILVGNGGFYLPQALARGADGVMTGFAYPEMLVGVYERIRSGDPQGAEDLFDRYLPIVCYEQQPGYGLAVRKEILRRRGAIRSARVRAPGTSLTKADREELDNLMRRLARRLEEDATFRR
jgi:4-hydroxy-tetrahydrodipicolinate synthase